MEGRTTKINILPIPAKAGISRFLCAGNARTASRESGAGRALPAPSQYPHFHSGESRNLTLRRLRGGVKIRKANFWGVAKSQTSSETLHPPRPLSRSHPPPQAAEGKKILPFPPHIPFPRKRESLPASAGNSAKRKCNVACGDAWRTMPPREIPAFAGMEGGREWKGGAEKKSQKT